MLLLFVIIQLIRTTLCDDGPIVSTALGQIQGVYEQTYTNRPYSVFYGIPFALPPVGNLRFEEAKPIEPWNGIFDGTNSTTILCSQVDHDAVPKGGDYMGVEDCLYLNVYVSSRQNPSQTELLDVLVHIHGGCFMFGAASIGPKFLMDRDLIVVSINYRPGVLGFLSTEDAVLPGNLGMKDQVLGLKWIKDNIQSFGGNPNSITLTGQSAGGASVQFHYLSPLSKGLFNRGISQSGTVLSPWVVQENALDKVRWVGRLVGCNQIATRDLVDCLKTVDVRELTETIREMRPWIFNPFSPLGVVVEMAGGNKFLPEHPYALLAKGEVYDVPWMNSVTSEEGLYPAAEFVVDASYLPELDERWLEIAPHVLDYNYTIPHDRIDEVSSQIRREYMEDEPISNETFYPLVYMISHRLFTIPAEEATVLHARATESPVYYYYFSYVREELESITIFFTGYDQHEAASHGDDYMFIFSSPNPLQTLSERDQKMQDIFLDMWTSFMRTGIPTVENLEWERVSRNLSEPLRQLHIQAPENMFMENAENIDMHRSMWTNMKFEENANLFSSSMSLVKSPCLFFLLLVVTI